MRWERALELLDEMKRSGLNPDVYSYSAAISACEKDKQWEKALEIFEKMQIQNVNPDVVAFNSAITACSQGSR